MPVNTQSKKAIKRVAHTAFVHAKQDRAPYLMVKTPSPSTKSSAKAAQGQEAEAPRKPKQANRAPGRPKVEDVAQIESQLLDVALKEFVTNGYGGTSMLRIIKAARISKTTMYSRFSSKEQLFRAIMRRQTERFTSAMPAGLSGEPGNLIKGLRAYANYTLKVSQEGDSLEVNRLIHSEARRFPELGMASVERLQQGVSRISRFIADCAKADGVPCKDPEAAAEAYMMMIIGWSVNVMLTDQKVSKSQRERWVQRAVRMLMASRAEW